VEYGEETCRLLEEAYEGKKPSCKVGGDVEVDLKSMVQRGKGASPAQGPVRRINMDGEHEEHWLEELSEAEYEAAALVLGFLTMQMLICFITDHKEVSIHGLHSKRMAHEVMLMNLSGIGFFVLLVAVSCFMVNFRPGKSIFNFRGYLAMAMAWCLERAGEWTMLLFVDLAMARVWSAFVMSAVAVVAVIVIDRIADGTPERKKREAAAKRVTLLDLEALDQLFHEHGPEGGEAPPAAPSSLSHSQLLDLKEDLNDNTPLEFSIETMLAGFSVLIGLVWDMAFESAEEIIVSPGGADAASKVISKHPVMAKVLLAVLLVSVVLPGWVMHIVPMARMPWRHHFINILRRNAQRGLVAH